MKRNLILLAFCFLSATPAQQPPVPPAAYVKNLQQKYPPVKSNYCADCYVWANPYFSAIIDVKLRESITTHGYFTPQREALVVQLHPDRSVYGTWHALPGFVNDTRFYTDINDGITNTLAKYAKGHYAAYDLCSWAYDGAILSCTYDFNEGIEIQGQNEGTEAEVEELTRALVGSTATDAAGAHYTGPKYPRVDYWKGSWGGQTDHE